MNGFRIGVLSDTHGSLPTRVYELLCGERSERSQEAAIVEQWDVDCDREGNLSLGRSAHPTLGKPRPCDLLLHGGDIGPQIILDELETIAPTIAVLGNNDRMRYWCSDGEVRPFRRFTVQGVEVALQHIPVDLQRSLKASSMPDLAIHGHTHVPEIDVRDGGIWFCPGSPTQARRGSGHRIGFVDIDDGRLTRITLLDPDAGHA